MKHLFNLLGLAVVIALFYGILVWVEPIHLFVARIIAAVEERTECLFVSENPQPVVSSPAATHSPAVRVIGYHPLDSWQVMIVNSGKRDRVSPGQVVTDRHGALVGRVIRVHAHTSEVLLITNAEHSVDAWVGEARYRVLVSGRFEKLTAERGLWLAQAEFINHQSEVGIGALVTTTGLDGRYPPGIPIGTVYKLREDEMHLFKSALVIPAVEFTALEEVVLLER